MVRTTGACHRVTQTDHDLSYAPLQSTPWPEVVMIDTHSRRLFGSGPRCGRHAIGSGHLVPRRQTSVLRSKHSTHDAQTRRHVLMCRRYGTFARPAHIPPCHSLGTTTRSERVASPAHAGGGSPGQDGNDQPNRPRPPLVVCSEERRRSTPWRRNPTPDSRCSMGRNSASTSGSWKNSTSGTSMTRLRSTRRGGGSSGLHQP